MRPDKNVTENVTYQ